MQDKISFDAIRQHADGITVLSITPNVNKELYKIYLGVLLVFNLEKYSKFVKSDVIADDVISEASKPLSDEFIGQMERFKVDDLSLKCTVALHKLRLEIQAPEKTAQKVRKVTELYALKRCALGSLFPASTEDIVFHLLVCTSPRDAF